METAKKLMVIVGIAAVANARYNGKSYAVGDEIPVAYEDIDSLVAQGILDKDDAAKCKAAAEEEARQYSEKADEMLRQAKAEAEANEKLKKAHDELLEMHARLKADLAQAGKVIKNLKSGLETAQSENREHLSINTGLEKELKASQEAIAALQAEKTALEKAAAKAKK